MHSSFGDRSIVMPKLHPVPRLPQRRKQRHCPLKVRATGEGSLGAAPPRAPSCPCTRRAPRRGCAIAYIQTLCGWCGCWRAPTWQGQARGWPSGTRATAVQVRDHDHRSPFEDHIKPSNVQVMVCQPPVRPSCTLRSARHLLGDHPPVHLTSSHLPRASCRRCCQGATCASWCSAPLPHPTSALPLPRAARGGGTLFAHKLRACPRTTRPATHPPFPRRCIQLNARTELACRARRCRGARMPSRPHFCDFCGWLGF